MQLKDVNVGDVVSLRYYGGSDYGGLRTVTVEKVDNDGLEGKCKERDGQYRKFLANHIGSLSVLQRVNTKTSEVRFDALKSLLGTKGIPVVALEVLTAEQMAKLAEKICYAKDKVTFNPLRGTFTVVKESWQSQVNRLLGTSPNVITWGGKTVHSVKELVDYLNTL